MANNKFTQIEMPDGSIYDISGGTEVIANPGTDATDSLTKITIGDITYDISRSGNYSGSGVNIKKLWEGSTGSTTILELSKSAFDYDIIVVCGTSDTGQINGGDTEMFLTETIKNATNLAVSWYAYDTRYVALTFSADGNSISCSYNNQYISDVYGVKFSSNHTYSTEEQIVGTWIDGKPIYEKTVVYEGVLTNEKTLYDTSGINVINLFNIGFYDSDNIRSGNRIINYERNISYDPQGIKVEINSDYGSKFVKADFTIQYTKTTD